MARTILIQAILFLAPFATYAAVLYLTKRDARESEHWTPRMLVTLGIVGVALMIGGLALFSHFGGSPPGGTYVPAHVEDGKLVPGQIK